MDAPKDKQDLIQRIRDERSKLEALLGYVSEKEKLIPLGEDGWSVKDHVAHIVIWEKRLVEWLNIVERGEVPQQLPPGMTWDDLDRWNEQTFEENRGRELTEVLDDFNRYGEEVIKAVDTISEDLLMRADSLTWRSGSPLWEMVAANTFWHYSEHWETIKDWQEARTSGG
jgi:hypothetical protein